MDEQVGTPWPRMLPAEYGKWCVYRRFSRWNERDHGRRCTSISPQPEWTYSDNSTSIGGASAHGM